MSTSIGLRNLSDLWLERCRKSSALLIPVSVMWGWEPVVHLFGAEGSAILCLLLLLAVGTAGAFPFFIMVAEQDKRQRKLFEEWIRERVRNMKSGYARKKPAEDSDWHDVDDEEIVIPTSSRTLWYQVLGVQPGDSKQKVRKAFGTLAKQLHSDSTNGKGDISRMRKIIEAWDEARQVNGWK